MSDAEVAEVVVFLETLTDRGFVTDARFSRPPSVCPVNADAVAAAEADNMRRQHNSPERP